VEYAYPTYGIDLTPQLMEQCCDTAVRLLDEVGFAVPNERFLKRVQGNPGLRIDGERVYFDPALTREYLDRFIASQASKRQPATEPVPATEWLVQINGYSMNVLDIETEEIHLATCQDLRDLIKLASSFGIGGYYPCMPQDLPPLMRSIACFKICWEMSENIQPYDYQHPAQIPYVYEMHQVMGRRFDISLVVPGVLCVDPSSLDMVLDFYADWKNNRDINFNVLDYGMVGITKPVTVIGCATMTLAETLALHILLNLFDPEIELSVSLHGGHPTDLRNACWAFGSPRGHLFRYLNSRTGDHLFGSGPQVYRSGRVLLETSSSAVDEQAAMEKMACGLLGAMQGSRTFGYAGVLCVDDLFSGVQFVIDVEMVNYIREMVEAFDPHPDIINADGLYEECRDVGLGNDTFISHRNTVQRLRNIVPSSQRIVREKLNSWLGHRTTLEDRARQEALERIRTYEAYHLPDDKQQKLDSIYAAAEAEFGN